MKKPATVNNLILIPFFAAIILFASAVWYVCYSTSLDPLAQTEGAANQVLMVLADEQVSTPDQVQQKNESDHDSYWSTL